jgi:hypothetical protein
MVDHLYQYSFGRYKNGDSIERELGRESVVYGGEWLVGLPFDLQIKTRRGSPMTLRLIRMATKVDPETLAEVAPQLVEKKVGLNPRFDADQDCVVSTTEHWFNGTKTGEVTAADRAHPEASRVFAAWLATQTL